jgi:hypothetical protein
MPTKKQLARVEALLPKQFPETDLRAHFRPKRRARSFEYLHANAEWMGVLSDRPWIECWGFSYPRPLDEPREMYEFVQMNHPGWEGKVVADFACAHGWNSVYLASNGIRVVAYDHRPWMLCATALAAARRGLDVELLPEVISAEWDDCDVALFTRCFFDPDRRDFYQTLASRLSAKGKEVYVASTSIYRGTHEFVSWPPDRMKGAHVVPWEDLNVFRLLPP